MRTFVAGAAKSPRGFRRQRDGAWGPGAARGDFAAASGGLFGPQLRVPQHRAEVAAVLCEQLRADEVNLLDDGVIGHGRTSVIRCPAPGAFSASLEPFLRPWSLFYVSAPAAAINPASPSSPAARGSPAAW